jgi:iron complex outermembrane receptor protein
MGEDMYKQHKKQLPAVICAVLGAVAFHSGIAAAQDAPSPAVASSPQTTATNSSATQAGSQNAKTLQGVQVTGSLIRSVDVEMAQPVVTITSQDIQKQGFATVGQFLQNLTASNSSSDMSKSDPYDSGPDAGGSFVDLRGLGAERTLVLIDGKRVGTSYTGLTNLDTIPASIIDHVDILADGASAVYGSDAIAGVVNIITKKDFNGAQLDTYDGQYHPGSDGMQQQYALTLGKSTERGSIVFTGQYQNQEAINAADRNYSACPLSCKFPYDAWQTQGAFGQILNDPSGNTLVLNNGGNPRNFNDYHVQIAPTTVNGDVVAPGDTYNYNNQYSLLSATNMKNLYSQGHYDIEKNLTVDFSASYNQQGNTSMLGGLPLSTPGIVDPQQPQFTNPMLSAQSYYNPYNAPGQTPQDVSFQRYLIEMPRITNNKDTNFRYSLGLEGFFNVGEHMFNWDAYYYETKYEGNIYTNGNIYLPNLMNALGPSFLGSNGVVQCGTPGNVISGCVPLNVLAGPGGYTSAMLKYIEAFGHEVYGSQEKGPQVDISGDVYQLPAGDVNVAMGLSHRNVSGYDTPDIPSTEGYTTNLAGQPTSGGYNVSEAYGEINVPLLKDLPGAQSLNLDVAKRFSHYNNFGNTNNSSFKLTWKPIDDLLVRASYGTGFRAPTVGDLYAGNTTTYPYYTDPCDVTYGLARYNSTVAKNCANGIGGQPALNVAALTAAGLGAEYANGFGQEQSPGQLITTPGNIPVYGPFVQGGNPKLKPETSSSTQIGFVYSPSFFTGFNATIDWYKYIVRDVISSIQPNEVLDNCYELGIASDCALFQRSAANNFQVSGLFMGAENQGYLDTAGYDVDLSYALPKFSFGQFKLDSHSTYMTKYNVLQYEGVPVSNEAGMLSNWRLRSNFTISWAYQDFGAQWTMRYFSPLKDACYNVLDTVVPCQLPNYYAPGVGVNPMQQVPSVTFNDLQVYWNAPWHGTLSVGANNIFNRIGPYAYGSYNGFDANYVYNPAYDYGRMVYIRYTQKF